MMIPGANCGANCVERGLRIALMAGTGIKGL